MNVEKIIIGGLPYSLINKDEYLDIKKLATESNFDKTEIVVRSTYPKERQLSYLFNEVVRQLLFLIGWKTTDIDDVRFNLAGGLYLLAHDNDMTWLRDDKRDIPNVIVVNGLLYQIRQDKDEYLEAAELLGEIPYTDLEIRVKSTVPRPMKNWVIVHELTHALLYECNFKGDHNDDTIVTPLGTLLYWLFRDNDFETIFWR